MKSKKTIVAAAAGVVALGAGLGVAGLASADPTPATPTSSPTATPSGGPAGPDGRGGPGRGQHGPGREAIAAELATKLGVDEAKVTEALKAIRDENRPAAGSTPTPGTTPTPGQTKPDPAAKDAELAKALAGKLGIDEAKVKTALDEIRAAQQADRATALKTRLDAAVKAGTLTQAEADAVTKAVEKGVIPGGR